MEAENDKGPGRPTKYDARYAKQAYNLCLLGATDKDLATFFEVAESTIGEWKHAYPEFSVSIKRGKVEADAVIAKSLYKRARGFIFTETVHEEIEIKVPGEGGKKVIQPATLKKTIRKFIAQDPTSMIFWLKNRQPKIWRDKQEIDHTSGGNEFKRFTLNVKPDTDAEQGEA
jgi:hypothetical protein